MRLPRSPRALTLVVAALGATLIGLVPIAAPASAAVTGSTSSTDVTLTNQCQTHTVSYSIAVSPGTYFWRLEIQTVSPEGLTSEGTVFTSSTSGTTGTATTLFCGSEAPGTWTVHASGIMEPVIGVQMSYALPDSSFTVSRAATRTALTKQRLHHHRVRLTATVTDPRPGGAGRTDGATVELQRLVDGSWQKVRDSRRPTSRGQVTKVVRVTGRTAFRAVTTGRGYFDGSVSSPLTIR